MPVAATVVPEDVGEKKINDVEVEASSTTTGAAKGPHGPRAECYKLCRYEELPAYLRHNPFVLTGYRVNFSFSLCLHSIFRLHNESWNIWTHLFGFAIFLWLGNFLLQGGLPWRMTAEPFVFMTFILTVEASMLSSAIFHAFNCHSPGTYKWTCRFDYSSISMLFVGAYSPMLYYAFICEPVWQKIYLSSFMALGMLGLIFSFLPFFSTPQYTAYRTCVFLALGWSTLMPLPHMLYIHGPWKVWHIARWELLVGLIYSVGAVIYAKRIPERWSPGKYDFSFMSSHSVWHMCTVAGALVQMYACFRVYEAFGTMFACAGEH